MGKQRSLSEEQILNILIELRKKAAINNNEKNDASKREKPVGEKQTSETEESKATENKFPEIKVEDEGEIKKLEFTFAYEVKRTGAIRYVSSLFCIHETHDGKPCTIIYDENGMFIAYKDNENKINLAHDIIILNLDKEELRTRIENITNSRGAENNDTSSSSDTTKGGGGRDKVKDEETEPQSKEKQTKPDTPHKDEKPILTNLRTYDINLNNKPLIPLNTMVNGPECRLFDALNLRNKLKDRLPEGVSIESFQNGYFSYVNSDELKAKDGKERTTPEVPVITTMDTDDCIIELDENILKPMEMGTTSEQLIREQTSIRVNEFGEAQNTRNKEDLMETSRFEIVNDAVQEGQHDPMFLSFQQIKEERQHGVRDTLGVNREIYFVRIPIEKGELSREKGYGAIAEELQPRGRKHLQDQSPEETTHEQNLETNETALDARENFFQRKAIAILNKHPELRDVYNLEDIKKMYIEYFPTCNDKEIEDKIVERGELENEFYPERRRGI